MGASSQVTGISSGFDTASIVEQLMKIEKIPYEKLDIKKQTQQLRLQAYQAVNSMFLKFRTSVGSLSSQKLWKSKSAASTNEKSLTATANEYAVNGSYSLRVAQLATSAQFMTKGFASSKTAFVKQKATDTAYKIGEIGMSSAKTRVDTSAKIDTLNGGKGVYRGSVRVTDRSNNTSVIDLSACDTVDDVVRTLNASAGAQITASVKDGRLHIADNSGGTGTIKIQNVGIGTTATDLGIAGVSEANKDYFHGRNVYTMGNDTSLGLLQDGLGIEEGIFTLRVTHNSEYYDVSVNVDDCSTVGDIMKRVNNEIEYRVQNEADDPKSGAGWELLEGLRFGLSDDKTAFALLGVKEGHAYQFYDSPDASFDLNQTPAEQLGLLGRKLVSSGQTTITFDRVLGSVDSPMLKNLSGLDGKGIGSAGSSSLVSTPFSVNTKISALNGGRGVDATIPLQIRLYEGGDDVSDGERLYKTFYDVVNQTDLNNILADGDSTILDLVVFMNNSIERYASNPANDAAGLKGMMFRIDENNQRLVIDGAQGGQKFEIMGTLANSLGLIRTGSTAIVNDGTDQVYVDTRDAVAAVNGTDGANKPLVSGNAVIEPADRTVKKEGEADQIVKASTLRALDVLHGLDMSDPDNLPTEQEALDAILAKLNDPANNAPGAANGLKLNLKGEYLVGWTGDTATGSGVYANLDLQDVNVDLSNLNLAAGATVNEFLDAVNVRIRDAVNAAASAEYGSAIEINAPQLRIDTYAKGFQWSNVDMTKDFSATGAVAQEFGVDRSLEAGQVTKHPLDTLGGFSFNPKTSGYLREESFNAANASTIMLQDLNNGASLTFAGADEDTIDFDFGDNKKISVTMAELRSAINAQSSLGTTMDVYAGVLQSLVNSKLTNLDGDNDASNDVSVKFAVGNNRLEITEIKNADRLIVSGAGAEAAKTGLSAVKIDSITDPVYSTAVGFATLKAAKLTEQAVTGLGDITVKIGDSAEFTLSTAGLTGDATLAQLVDKLNQQLAAKATDAGFEDLAGVRFMLNDAGTGLAVDNTSGKEFTFVNKKDANTIARDLGFIDKDGNGVSVDSYGHYNANSLNRKYMSRATSLSSILGSANAIPGSIQITNAGGASRIIDLAEAKTVGDVLDAINAQVQFGVQAFINDRGDGITLLELYPSYAVPDPLPTGNIKIEDYEDGNLAKKLGIAGEGTRDKLGASMIEGTQRATIDVMSSDTLESLMYRISEKGYKTAIVNDGSSANPYRLTISSTTTGEASDFVIESDLDMFGFNQTSRGRDSKVLYGDPNSGSSPILLSSSTNSNSNAILGLTLDLKAVSADWTTITVDTDKEKVTEELKNMVQTYNDLNDLVSYLDAYDAETGEPGVLFGDSSIRKLMEDINEMFYLVFNPNQKTIGSVDANGKQQTWTWMDLGVSLSAKNSNTDGTGNWYSSMDLDLDALDSMVASNWDVLYNILAGQRNASDSTLDKNVRATSSFNGKLAEGFKEDNAINGDTSSASWGINNGIMADGTIAQGQNEYTVYFQKATTISRMSIYHYDMDTALKNFTVEYQDANTGKWETLRDVKNNAVAANHLGLALPTSVTAIRIKAESTNASDNKFRLLDVQVFEDTGLAGKLNQLTTALGDSQTGFLASRNTEVTDTIKDIDEQMARLQERLDSKEAGLWRRFTAMETALGQLQSQSNYFSSMMGSLTSNSGGKK